MQFATVDESGIVLSLEPGVEDRLALEIPEGIPSQNLHLSLASIAADPSLDLTTDLAALLTAVLPVAAATSPLTGAVTGAVSMVDGGAAYLFDVDGLTDFLTELAAALSGAGVNITPAVEVIPIVRASDSPASLAYTGSVTFDGLGVRFNGQAFLVPLSGVAPAASADPTEAPVTDPTTPDAVPTETVPADAPATAAITADEAIVGVRVAWVEDDGTPRSGVITNADGAVGTPPSVSVAPDDDQENEVEVALDNVSLEVIADPEVAPEGGSEDLMEPVEVPEAPETATYRIEVDHPDCLANGDGTASVAVVRIESGEDGEEIADVESCWLDEAAAQAHIDDLMANGDPDLDEEPVDAMPMFATAKVGLEVDTSELERAASIAGEIQKTLAMLETIAPDRWGTTNIYVTSGDAVTVTPAEAAIIEEVAAPVVLATDAPADAAPVVVRGPREMLAEIMLTRADGSALSAEEFVDEAGLDLADIADEDLISELARRWAEATAAALVPAPEDDPAVEPVAASAEDPVVAADAPVAEEPTVPEVEPEVVMSGGLAVAFSDTTYELEGVLIVEGLPSGDNRMIAEGALTSRDLPLPLMLQTVNAPGHDGSVIAGSIHEIVRMGEKIMFRGNSDSGTNGQEALRLLTEGTMRGISADIDSVVVEFLTEDGQPVSAEDVLFNGVYALEVLVEGRIMGGTLTPFPAFQEAQVKVISSGSPDEAMVASGLIYRGDTWRVSGASGVWLAGTVTDEVVGDALVASGATALVEAEAPVIPVNPPTEWFSAEPGEDMTADQNFTVYPDGRCYGLVAKFGTCHIGFSDRCVPVPKSASKYGNFRVGTVLTAEGTLVKTGTIFMDTDHAELGLLPVAARDHYAHTGCAAADVAMYDTEIGVLAAGAMRSDLSPEKQRAFRASQPSPDWRKLNGRLDAVGCLAVNTSGFIVESLVASGVTMVPVYRGRFDSVSEEVTAMVASGYVQSVPPEVIDDRDATIASLREAIEGLHAIVDEFLLRPVRSERAAAALAHLSAPTAVEAERAQTVTNLMARFGPKVTAPEADAEFVATFVAEEPGCGGSCGGHEGACTCEVPAPEA